MDDLKLYSTTKKGLEKELQVTETFSNDIKMDFGLDKCRINAMNKGVWTETQNYNLKHTTYTQDCIQTMQPEDTYKYLGFAQSRGIDKKQTKEQIIQETKRRINLILKTKLSGQNMVTAINTYALPVLMYSFGVIKWTATELDGINRVIRVAFTKHRAHHPRSSIERFHLPRNKGGRGIIDIRNIYYQQIDNLRDFFRMKAQTSHIHKAVNHTDDRITPLNLISNQNDTEDKVVADNEKINAWKSKELHGRYIHTAYSEHIDTKATLQWLCNSNLFAETEGFMMAIQDQNVPTLNYKKYILKENIASTSCRICHQKSETIEHILSACSILAPKEYTRRHNNVAKIVHQSICKLYDETTATTPYYKYQPRNIVELPTATIYWNRTIQTDRTVQHNRPDITLKDEETKVTYLIDISIPAPANIQAKHRDKVDKYLPLAQDVKEVWSQNKVVIVPIIIGATGEIPLRLHEGLKTLRIHPTTYKQMQKVVILESTSIMRQVLSQNA